MPMGISYSRVVLVGPCPRLFGLMFQPGAYPGYVFLSSTTQYPGPDDSEWVLDAVSVSRIALSVCSAESSSIIYIAFYALYGEAFVSVSSDPGKSLSPSFTDLAQKSYSPWH